MTGPRFTVTGAHNEILLDRGREILLGNGDDLLTFCRWLNRDPPADIDSLRVRIMGMIMQARGVSFVMGEGLRSANANEPEAHHG